MPQPVEIIICRTCRHPDGTREVNGVSGGETLARALAAALPAAQVSIGGMNCLMACQRHAALHLRSPGKIGYTFGGFSASPKDVETLRAWVELYRASTDGTVPFRQWPAGVKGRLITRVPPLP